MARGVEQESSAIVLVLVVVLEIAAPDVSAVPSMRALGYVAPLRTEHALEIEDETTTRTIYEGLLLYATCHWLLAIGYSRSGPGMRSAD